MQNIIIWCSGKHLFRPVYVNSKYHIRANILNMQNWFTNSNFTFPFWYTYNSIPSVENIFRPGPGDYLEKLSGGGCIYVPNK